MKKMAFTIMLGVLLVLCAQAQAQAGEVDILVTKLVEKGVLTPAEAQIILDETKVQVSKDIAQAKAYSAPEWTQRIKMSGDVRFRTQGDWAKDNTSKTANNGIQNQRIRERVRGRFQIEGRVNDFTYAGTRLAGGDTKSNSTNDTLEDFFNKKPVEFDQYYIRFEAPAELRRGYGQYFSDARLWLGKFPIPFEYSELVWDSDINPGGIAFQYASPDIRMGDMPVVNLYSNLGMFWLDEDKSINTDPMLFGFQVGAKTEPFGPMDSTLNVAVTYYDFANLKNKSSTGSVSATTNTRVIPSDGSPNNLGTYRYEFGVFDLLMQLDNAKVMDMAFPHGFYADFIYNTGCNEPSNNKGLLLGAYIGKKKLKEPKDWKARAEWRYIERDAIPDFMPDSDFYGFGPYTSPYTGLNAGQSGIPKENGTNGRGVNMAFEYQLFKNTSLNFEYYWMEPIKSWNKTTPWHELQIDVITKF